MSLYEDLEISPTASAELIKRAFQSLANKHHPDRPGGDVEMFVVINTAYQILSDPERRAYYDKHGVDKQAESDIVSRALQTISASLVKMILTEGQQSLDIDYDDLINILREDIKLGQNGIPERLRKADMKIARIERTIRRLSKKGGEEDLIKLMLMKQITGIRVRMAGLETEKQIGTKMLEILADYSYSTAN